MRDSVQNTVIETGFYVGNASSVSEIDSIISGLGSSFMETDIVVKESGRKFLTSAEAMDYHTDHFRADFILWWCLRQTTEGGESVLVDAESVFTHDLSRSAQRALYEIRVGGHKVLEDDEEYYPLVSDRDGKRKFYYAPWLIVKPKNGRERDALDEFEQALRFAEPVKAQLKPNDFLLVDNSRVVHGRTAIMGTKDRLLKRFWISESL